MRSLQDEISQAQKNLVCPICRRHFSLQDIQLHAFPGQKRAELTVICHQGHFPVILLVPIEYQGVLMAKPISKKELDAVLGRVKLATTIEEIIKI